MSLTRFRPENDYVVVHGVRCFIAEEECRLDGDGEEIRLRLIPDPAGLPFDYTVRRDGTVLQHRSIYPPAPRSDPMTTTTAELEKARALIRREEARIENLEYWGEDDFRDGDVLVVERSYSNPGSEDELIYTYALLKADDGWWTTGSQTASIALEAGRRNSWLRVVEWLGEPATLRVWECTAMRSLR